MQHCVTFAVRVLDGLRVMNKPDWDKRISRAEELVNEYSFAAEVVNFYARLAEFQKSVYEQAVRQSVGRAEDQIPLRERLDLRLALRHLPALFSMVEKHGPAGLGCTARNLRQQSEEQWHDLLTAFVTGNQQRGESTQFFARACLQPYAECLAGSSHIQVSGYTGSICALCHSRPLAAVLRPEGDGGKRSLLCSFCLLEWNFHRIVCPSCGERDNQKLPRYSAAEFAHVRVEACDTCKMYLKSVDLTINGLAVPIVDEIATAPLDLWAGEHGYSKIELNIMSC